MSSPAALLAWLATIELFEKGFLRALASQWRLVPTLAARDHQAALKLREAIYRALINLALCKPVAETDLDIVSHALSEGSSGTRLLVQREKCLWTSDGNATGSLAVLRPIAVSAVALLTGPRIHKIKQCEDERGCGWLFLDESRAQNRRWCSMGDCGNRAKARRHYLHGRAAKQE